ncbi:MAG TPA: aminotransferase class V-fold PLP-dependent enzyme [Candidatus Obscuribacterales bacterium]
MLKLEDEARKRLWDMVVSQLEQYAADVDSYPVSPQDAWTKIQEEVARFDFQQPVEPEKIIEFAASQLSRNQVHTPSRHYYGLFNPCPTSMSIFADAMVAAFNPQMAGAGHNPFATTVEQHLITTFGKLMGFSEGRIDGTFTTGGAEANHTALVCALSHRFVQFRNKGVRSLSAQPVVYVSAEAHHSIMKAARLSGLGTDAVREIPVDSKFRLDLKVLERFIADDKKSHNEPVMIVGTAGTTSCGAIDPLQPLSELALKYHCWFHVDAAWGGAAAIVPEMRGLLSGIDSADSITFDCHKWLSVPMGAGTFITRHTDVLDRTFRIANDYMPRDDQDGALADPYARSMQWSRRFIGLKVFMSLAVAGLAGYADTIRHQTQMGDLLRQRLIADEWNIVSDTTLPIVCFNCKDIKQNSPEFLSSIAKQVVDSGNAWISTTRLGQGINVVRACITNFRTDEQDVERLVATLQAARQAVQQDLLVG